MAHTLSVSIHEISSLIQLVCAYLSLQGDYVEAEKWYLACHDFNPSEPQALLQLTLLHENANRVDDAFRILQVSIRIIN